MGCKVLAKVRDSVPIYSEFDDAIIQGESDIQKYVETHDPKYLTLEEPNDADDQFGAAVYHCTMPDWEEAERLFWDLMLDLEAFEMELFRVYAEQFENLRYRDPKSDKIKSVVCAKVYDSKVGRKVVRPEVLEMLPRKLQRGIGRSIATLSGIADRALELMIKVSDEYAEAHRIVPGEHSKNSSPPASSTGSTESTSGAGGVSSDPI